MPVLLKVRNIGASRHESKEFTLTAIYIPSLDREGLEVYVYIKYKLHLVEGFKMNMFIRNNIFSTKGFTINLASPFAHILSCKVIIVINVRSFL